MKRSKIMWAISISLFMAAIIIAPNAAEKTVYIEPCVDGVGGEVVNKSFLCEHERPTEKADYYDKAMRILLFVSIILIPIGGLIYLSED